MTEDYVRNALVLKVVDGDTLDLLIDLECSVHTEQRVRLLGLDCPEMNTEEGRAAKAYAVKWVAAGGASVQVRTHKDKSDKYGRLLAEVGRGEDSLNRALLKDGHAVPM